jgi:hypothetical protein
MMTVIGTLAGSVVKKRMSGAALGSWLCSCLLVACGGTPAPAPTATVAPTATLAPSPTATATATFTPMPTLTPDRPAAGSGNGEPTPTWTAVPGNPAWSFWRYENVEFQLPVAWRKGEAAPAGVGLFDGPGGDDRPQLSITIQKTPGDDDAAAFAQGRLAALKSSLGGFNLMKSEAASLSGLPARRLIYRYTAPGVAANGSDQMRRGVAWYAVRGGVRFAFEFGVDDRRFAALQPVFDDIAGRVNILP